MTAARPNILFIMADDHAAKAISCYGADINKTPNLDRIAQQGMRFNHCYVTNSICTPSRATILTGMHNHTNLVHTLSSDIDNNIPNVAKQLRAFGGYTTAVIGKWHLGEGKAHEPKGFDYWDVIPGQGQYFDPLFINDKGMYSVGGYATDIITDKTINFIKQNESSGKPFFVMCHHKAPHRSWECDPKHRHLYTEEVHPPQTFDDDYKNRAKAAGVAKMRVEMDMTYLDLGLAQPEAAAPVTGERSFAGLGLPDRRVPNPVDVTTMAPLIDIHTGQNFTFRTSAELKNFKFQRYMQRYLRTIHSIDENVGRLLDYLEETGQRENTLIIYTSDQGFFLGEHGWFDKRFIYEESFQMPFLISGPGIKAGVVNEDIISNVDFAPTWLDFAKTPVPSYMQGKSFLPSLFGQSGVQSEWETAYHRYWMHADANHNAYAHYGIRSKRYKLIFWYNQGLGLAGTGADDAEQEWELFDCQEDPLEIFNLWPIAGDEYAEIKEKMVRLLEAKMAEIGDEPAHKVGLSAEQLTRLYPAGQNISARAEQHNM